MKISCFNFSCFNFNSKAVSPVTPKKEWAPRKPKPMSESPVNWNPSPPIDPNNKPYSESSTDRLWEEAFFRANQSFSSGSLNAYWENSRASSQRDKDDPVLTAMYILKSTRISDSDTNNTSQETVS